MDKQNQLFNLMYSNHFYQNVNQSMFQNINPNNFMLSNNAQFNMMQNMNQFNNMINQQNLMMQNMNQINNMNNQQNLMMQNMNQFNNFDLNKQIQIMQGMNNQINFNNNNDINIPLNQINLLNSIISFYKNNNNDYMSYDNPNQIKNILNLLNPNYPGLKYDNTNKIEDPLYYIKTVKKTLKFINSDYIIYKVRIPITITKYDLYTIAKLYKNNNQSSSDVLLIYQNKVLAQDESSIEFMSEDEEIRIIEPRNYPDDSYYNFLNQKNGFKYNIIFYLQSGNKKNLILPVSTSISDMIKAFKLKFGLENDYTELIYNSIKLSAKDNRKIMDVIINGSVIFVLNIINSPYVIGKSVVVNISYNTKKILENWIFDIGLLNSIKYIIDKVESFHRARIKNLSIGNKKLTRDDERCLSEIGIFQNFDCIVEFEEIN